MRASRSLTSLQETLVSRKVIVVPAAPHYKNAAGNEEIWYGRLFKGIMLARYHDAPLVVVGDGNGGWDVAEFAALARAANVQVRCEVNGVDKRDKNTRGDMRAAAHVIAREEFGQVNEVVLVTCWYHVPRCGIELRNALRERLPDRTLAITPAPVLAHFLHGLHRLFHHHGELRGAWDAYLRRPHLSRGQFSHLGKPDLR
ncbi:YdcF family protein [Patescibacteria group bacterium]|nr:YdcF family protein [Patescibacteria group bacterium]